MTKISSTATLNNQYHLLSFELLVLVLLIRYTDQTKFRLHQLIHSQVQRYFSHIITT